VVDQLPVENQKIRVTSKQRIKELETQKEILESRVAHLEAQLETAKQRGQLSLL
jgi:chaperonin cofactor prefoldin